MGGTSPYLSTFLTVWLKHSLPGREGSGGVDGARDAFNIELLLSHENEAVAICQRPVGVSQPSSTHPFSYLFHIGNALNQAE